MFNRQNDRYFEDNGDIKQERDHPTITVAGNFHHFPITEKAVGYSDRVDTVAKRVRRSL